VYHSDAKGFETGFGGGDWAGVHLRISKGDATIPMQYYVCRQCGYFELYVRDVAALAKLDGSGNWKRVEKG
jgi:hypothetical protein